MSSAYQAMSDEQLEELTEQALRDHEAGKEAFQPRGEDARRTARTVPISLRLPAPLLARIKAAAAERGLPYQRLIKRWLEEALERQASPESPPVTVHLSAEQLASLCEHGSLDLRIKV